VRYWWVNRNQTFRQEIDGGYLWSPKRNKNGNRNSFNEFMREVSPESIVFSFCDTRIAALGIVDGYWGAAGVTGPRRSASEGRMGGGKRSESRRTYEYQKTSERP
jgi:hypothetical protein